MAVSRPTSFPQGSFSKLAILPILPMLFVYMLEAAVYDTDMSLRRQSGGIVAAPGAGFNDESIKSFKEPFRLQDTKEMIVYLVSSSCRS